MDIVVQYVSEPADMPMQPPLVRETTSMDHGTFPDPDYGTRTVAELGAAAQHRAAPQEPKARGRPRGSKNKPKIIEQLQEPSYEEIAPPPKKPRAPRSRVTAPPRSDIIPQPQTPLQVAASMLEILRLEQAERMHRKSQL